MREPRRWFLSVSLLALWPLSAWVAGTPPASLEGRVLDFGGGPVPGALVAVRKANGSLAAAVETGPGGTFQIPDLEPDSYDVEISLEGFHRMTLEAVHLEPGLARPLEIVLSKGPAESTVRVTTPLPGDGLSGASLRRTGAPDAGEALAILPGFWKIRKGGIASDVVFRGYQGENLNVLIDGVRIQGACPNNMDPGAFHVDLSEVAQVDTGTGGQDLRNAGSLGGTVNFVTQMPETGPTLRLRLSAGSFSAFNPSAVYSYGGEQLSFVAGASRRTSRPFKDGHGFRFTEGAGYRPSQEDSDAYRIATGWAGLWWDSAAGHALGLRVSRQEADHILYPYLLMDGIWDNTDRLEADYTYSPQGKEGALVQAQVYATHVSHWMTDGYRTSSLASPRPYSMATYARTRTEGGRLELRPIQGLTVGTETFERRWFAVTRTAMSGYSSQYSLPAVVSRTQGVYALGTFSPAASVHLQGGFRIDASRASANPRLANQDLYWAYNGTRSLSRRETYASGSLRLTADLPGHVSFSLGAGSTARFPDPQELFFGLKRMGADWVGNPELAVPRNRSLSLGISWSNPRSLFRLRLYRDRIQNFIFVYDQEKVHPVPGVMNPVARTYTNADARFSGGEFWFAAQVGQRWRISLEAAAVRAHREGSPDGALPPGPVAEIPPASLRSALRYEKGRWFAEAEGLFAARQNRVDPVLRERPTPGWGIANLRAGLFLSEMELTVAVRNLFDRYYRDHLSYQRDPFRSGHRVPEPGRTVTASLALRF